MLLKRKTFFIILMLLNFLIGKDCLAATSANPFQHKWVNDYGHVAITNCKGMKCKIDIWTTNGAHSCEFNEELTVLSNHVAVFQIKNEYLTKKSKKKLFPITLSLSKNIITVSVPEKSREAASGHCGMSGFFEGEYTNVNVARIYKTSFNCDKAQTKIEVAICQSPELAYADKVLSTLYLQLKVKKLDNIVKHQKEWINDRNTCTHSSDLNACLSDKYRDRILSLQQDLIVGHSGKANGTMPYNTDYLFYLSGLSDTGPYDIFGDLPLQSYLKSILPKRTIEEILPTRFYEMAFAHQDDALIMITGGAPGLYKIYEGALVLTKDHRLWLAYINIDDDSKKHLIILCPKGDHLTAIPALLKKWVDRLLPHMDNKDVVYKKIFSQA